MSKDILPNKVDPFRFAENAVRLDGTIPLTEMQRLSSSLSSTEGNVLADVEFGIDEQGIRFMRGQFSARLMLQCQRCLEPFAYDITGHFLSGIVHTTVEADQLPKSYDALIAKDGILHILDVIEDELIISLPIVPMHHLKDCKVKLPLVLDAGQEADKENPFKVIELLRSKKHNK